MNLMEINKRYYGDIDVAIGSKNSRFFGTGFKKVSSQISDIFINCNNPIGFMRTEQRIIEVNDSALGCIYAKGMLSYPEDWSKKTKGGDLKPHLSTVDALNLSIQLNEMFLIYKYNLGEDDRTHIWIRKCFISAGNAPHDNLEKFDIYSICKITESSSETSCFYTSKFESVIGSIKVICEIDHVIKEDSSAKASYSCLNCDELLGNTFCRLYGNGYRYSDYDICDIKLDIENECVENIVNIKRPGSLSLGIESGYDASISMIDSIILGGQLSQVLLYGIDKVHRDETGTIWMRKATLVALNPFPVNMPFLATTHLTNTKVINMKDKLWRIADICSSFGNITCNYSLAYELPSKKL